MKRKITIDLATDLKLDLTLEEHEVLLAIIKKSIQLKKKEVPKPEGLLFDVPVINPNATTTFSNSAVKEFCKFEEALKQEKEIGIDLEYYFNCVKDWSEMNQGKKRTSKGWIATARTFIRSDSEKKKVKMMNAPNNVQSDKDLLSYLQD